ncbi:MAG: hypothetical protein Q9219_002904 [cf. Caloplaca sp. 3 TL-2023]
MSTTPDNHHLAVPVPAQKSHNIVEHTKLTSYEKSLDLNIEDETNATRELDVRKKQVFHGRYLVWLAYQSIGVIYGDIGTSPLYVYSSTFSSSPSYDDLLGALSLIIWTVTLMIRLRPSLLAVARIILMVNPQANIVRRDPREEQLIKIERVHTSSLPTSSRFTRELLERSSIMKAILKVVGVLGVSLVMSDGILTPAQSVLGAIQGLKIVDDGITTATIVGTSCAILVLLFLIQPFGTSKIGTTFAPVVILWLGLNNIFGIYNLVRHDHSVLKAFSPVFAGRYLVRNKTDGWKSLGGILLAFTGVEALFADLGAFTRSDFPEAVSNPFFNAVPPGMFYPSLVVAILASVVASQTMITATFQVRHRNASPFPGA